MKEVKIAENNKKRYIDNEEIIFETNCPRNRANSILRILISIAIVSLLVILLNLKSDSPTNHTLTLTPLLTVIFSIIITMAFLMIILPAMITIINVSYFIMTKTNLYVIKNNIVSYKIPLENIYISIRDVQSWTYLHNTKFISFFQNKNNKIKFLFECSLNDKDENKNTLFINALSLLSNRKTTEFTEKLDLLEPKIAIFGGSGLAMKFIK